MQNESSEKKSVTITLDREKMINAVIVIQLVLLVVFGWQILGIKKQLEGKGNVAAKVQAGTAGTPTPSAGAPTPGARVATQILDTDHVLGNPDAPVLIVEYSDFECPFCERAFPTVKQVMDTYGDDVALVYRHFPLSFHPQAQKSAEASECAADQGKFWEYHDKVFEQQVLLSGGIPQMKKWAGELGLNQSQFDSCLDSGEKAAKVQADMAQGGAEGVTGTPGFLINGIAVTGAQPFSSFQQVIDAELANS